MNDKRLIPHFVVDRPMSLRILSGLDLQRYSTTIGIMTQANSTVAFRKKFSMFPCIDYEYCGVVDGACPHQKDFKKCKKGQYIKKAITTIADSGVFTKEGGILDYPELFQRYDEMKVERGIILDVLRNRKKTIESAKRAMKIYNNNGWNFKLVGVTQGKTPKEYIDCYNELKKIGFEEIAIGGLLTKRKNTVRYVYTKDDLIKKVVGAIKDEWEKDRCFVLGVYNHKRHDLLESLGVHGADYKGWLFKYSKHFEDPVSHHIDRLYQTRKYIEESILSKMSGINTFYSDTKNPQKIPNRNLVVLGKRVFSNSNTTNVVKTKPNMSHPIVVISCGKRKSKKIMCAAEDAYIGRSFLIKKEFAENLGCPWFIFSAKFGLIRPTQIIKPDYDKTIKSKQEIFKISTMAKQQISQYPEFSEMTKIIFLGPIAYMKSLQQIFMNNQQCQIIHLTKSMKQGESQKAIKKYIEIIKNEKLIDGLEIANIPIFFPK
jgi:hypothetical protein